MMTFDLIPDRAFAEATRQAIERHKQWDSPHMFSILCWDGERLRTGLVTMIPDIEPTAYPWAMASVAADYARSPARPACGYLLQIEAHGVAEPPPGASAAERARYDADRLGRTFHRRADAVEAAIAWCADLHGRLWAAVKPRGKPGVQERFYPAGQAPGGQMIDGLLALARLVPR